MFKKKMKGFGGFFALVILFLTTLIVAVLMIELGKAYTTKCKSQTVADAVANGVGTHASTGSSLDLTKATEMFNKFTVFYSRYNLSMNRSAINNNHVIIRAVSKNIYRWNKGALYNSIIGSQNLSGYADVELVPQTQLAKIKNAFPSDRMLACNPFVTGEPGNILQNNAMLYETLLSQFYVEGRNRYRYSDKARTIYGDLDAYELLMFDAFKALGYSASFEGWTNANINDTKGEFSDKPLTDGYVYTGEFEGHRYIVYNPNEEGQAIALYLDDSKESGMTLKRVDFNQIVNIQRSPTKWYVPKNEEETRKKQNTINIE